MLGRQSGIGNRIPRFPFFLPGNGDSEGIPVSRFRRETGNPRFPIRPGPGIGVPIRRAGDFLVWARRWQGRRGLDLPRAHGPGCGRRAGACRASGAPRLHRSVGPLELSVGSKHSSRADCTVLSNCKRQLLLTNSAVSSLSHWQRRASRLPLRVLVTLTVPDVTRRLEARDRPRLPGGDAVLKSK